MKISIICSDVRHPVRSSLERWAAEHGAQHEIALLQSPSELVGGDILFAISCSDILRPAHRALFRHALVVHASDLPNRRGWSPHIWAIIEGETTICVSLLTADDPVDSGKIHHQIRFDASPYATLREINARLFAAELALMDWAVAHIDDNPPRDQVGEPSYCRKRTPEDSKLDPHQSIAAQFNTLRIADSNRFPAFFDLDGHRYSLDITLQGPVNDANQ